MLFAFLHDKSVAKENPLADFSTLEIRGPIKITISKKVKLGVLLRRI